MTRRAPFVTACLALAACAGGGSDSTAPTSHGQLQLAVIAGAAQADTILALLATPITVQAVRVVNGISTPAASQLVNFVVVEPGCGRPYAGSAITDASGTATDRWELGTVAGVCHMEARAVDQVTAQPVVFGSTTATILPGAVDSIYPPPHPSAFLGAVLSNARLAGRAADRVGNLITSPRLTVTSLRGWTVSDTSVTVGATETTDTLTLSTPLVTRTTSVTAIRDLRSLTWAARVFCGPGAQLTDAGVALDSVLFGAAVVDSVRYNFGGASTNDDAAGLIYWHGTGTAWRHDGTSGAFTMSSDQPFVETPGALTVDGLARVTSKAPVTYSGGGWCGNGDSAAHPVVMTAQ